MGRTVLIGLACGLLFSAAKAAAVCCHRSPARRADARSRAESTPVRSSSIATGISMRAVSTVSTLDAFHVTAEVNGSWQRPKTGLPGKRS